MNFFKLETFDLPKEAAEKRLRRRFFLLLAGVSVAVVVALIVFLLG